jgi:hypothetical protein
MKLRRPGVEDERGNPVAFFQQKEMADSKGRKENAPLA